MLSLLLNAVVVAVVGVQVSVGAVVDVVDIAVHVVVCRRYGLHFS